MIFEATFDMGGIEMKFRSTRNSSISLNASEVILKGISEEGGLFVPESFPDLRSEMKKMSKMTYNELSKKIIFCFLTDFTEDEIVSCVENAYTAEKFGAAEPVKLKKTDKNTHILELWHGPTCAFKDMALQILPHFLTTSLKKNAGGKKAMILVATSGDTGKAALEGFKGVDGTEIIVFYPKDGVSDIQKRQMATQEGENLFVCGVDGNFDDTQTGVKEIFTDEEIIQATAENQLFFSSANSINFGRLLPQIIYYFYAYFKLYQDGEIESFDDKINVVVPTGNFGNILAAYYAMQMGLPVNRFICASNANNVLTDFINTGVYNKKREFHLTSSPSMDILISSNLERLLFHIAGEDSEKLGAWMNDLNANGVYEIDAETKNTMKKLFCGGYCDDDETAEMIKKLFAEKNYLADTHTAVAVGVYEKYLTETGDKTPAVIASTASPFKFADSVCAALGAEIISDSFQQLEILENISGEKAQSQLKNLKEKEIRFSVSIDKTEMPEFVRGKIENRQESV